MFDSDKTISWRVSGERHLRNGRFVLLAPREPEPTLPFHRVHLDPARHERLLASMQKLRGRVYLQDGAIQAAQLSADQRHQLDTDRRSWHLLVTDAEDRVSGCARFLNYDHTTPFDTLGVASAAISRLPGWSDRFRSAVTEQRQKAHLQQIAYAEVGGWAIAEERRGKWDCLQIALSTYALAQLLGGCIGLTTATTRHASASILHRIGGQPLDYQGTPIPAYFDPQYQCEMQVLRFDSSAPDARFQEWVDGLRGALECAPVICRTPSPENRTPWADAGALVPHQKAVSLLAGGHSAWRS